MKIEKIKWYLAHPCSSRKYVREWELQFEAKTGIELMNPFYDLGKGDDGRFLDTHEENEFKEDFREVVNKDLDAIYSGRGILAVIDGNKSIGTFQEMVYANLAGKPVLAVITDGREKHEWIRYHSRKILTRFDDPEIEDFMFKMAEEKIREGVMFHTYSLDDRID